ncbi:MAG: hypothetical protein ACRCVT_16155 [Leadbetterella sp.]
MESTTNLSKGNGDLNSDRVPDGYALFEYTEVIVHEKPMFVLLQVVNESFDDKIKVYFNPWAMSGPRINLIGPIGVGGGDLSFFVKKGNLPAYKVFYSNFEENFDRIFGDCQSLLGQFNNKKVWGKFEEMVFAHSECK